MSKIIQTFDVTGMTCNGCLSCVHKTLSEFSENVTVTLDPPKATLTNATVDLITLNNALQAVGKYHLIPEKSTEQPSQPIVLIAEVKEKWLKTYQPLLILFAYILAVSLAIEFVNGAFVLHRFMPNFMAGFFLSFSFFKLLDLKGFASSYAMYDLLAMRVPIYGFIYPLIELSLGLAYVLNFQPFYTNLATFVVMTFSTLGVLKAVLNKQKIRCACLGAVFNLPMSTVTIIEDILMAAMAFWMLF